MSETATAETSKSRENGIGVWYCEPIWIGASSVEEAKEFYAEYDGRDEGDDFSDISLTEVDDLDAADVINIEAYERGEEKFDTYRDVIKMLAADGTTFPAVVATEDY